MNFKGLNMVKISCLKFQNQMIQFYSIPFNILIRVQPSFLEHSGLLNRSEGEHLSKEGRDKDSLFRRISC